MQAGKNFILWTIICVLALGAASAWAEGDVSVRASADRKSITIGDRIAFAIEVIAPNDAKIQMPAFTGNMIGDFEIKDSNVKTSGLFFGKKKYLYRYHITIYAAGKIDIPRLDIKYKLKGSQDWVARKTAAIPVDVRSVLPKELPADIKDIKGPASYFELNWFLIAGALSAVIVLIIAIVIIRKIRARKPIRLPHETALEELEAARSQLINSGDVKEYFVGVSDCIRRYIERVFSLKAPEMTSEEFLNSLRDSAKLTITHKDLLKGFMNACDLVKFAKYKPTGEETENLHATAVNFVNETREVK
jgi:hypothetical protein